MLTPICLHGNLMTEFCTHAVDSLEDVILEAIRQKFDTFALTEHMPRDQPSDLYPDEVLQDAKYELIQETSHSRRSPYNFR